MSSTFSAITRSFQWDLARQVERLDWLLAQLPRYAKWGYQEVHLHLEDAVEYPSLPGVARRDAYTFGQLGRLVDAATRVGIKVVPIVNLLGHTQYLIKTPELRDLNELRASDGSPLERGQVCPLHPRTLDVAEKLLRDMAPFCTAGKVHVGLDESYHLGKCPQCQREIEDIGLGAHFAGYIDRLNGLTKQLGLKMGLWADMFYFIPDAIPLLPSGITAYEWYYHGFKRHPKIEPFNFAGMDIATPLIQRGLNYYGCPMNGAFRFEPLPIFKDRIANIIAWWQRSQRIGATGFLVSSWEPHRLAIELTTAIDAAAASLWLEPDVTDPCEMLARGFERMFGRRGRAAAKLALSADRYPFSGYPRWEINTRWDTVSRRESLLAHRREVLYFTKLVNTAKAQKVPVALHASLSFRKYLSVRDLAVRELARADFAALPQQSEVGITGSAKETARATKTLSAAMRDGRRAAATMWTRTRSSRVISPNEHMVVADQQRLKALQRADPILSTAWQLCYAVWNFAPATQLVGVQQRQADGTWMTLQSCHTIEFQTSAAFPRGTIIRQHAAPCAWAGDTSNTPQLRFFVQGIGQVKVGRIELRSGRLHYPAQAGMKRWILLGQPAPKSGWPDWSAVVNLGITFRFGRVLN